jgi:hypothetical protein
MSTNHLIIGLGGTGGKIIRAFTANAERLSVNFRFRSGSNRSRSFPMRLTTVAKKTGVWRCG